MALFLFDPPTLFCLFIACPDVGNDNGMTSNKSSLLCLNKKIPVLHFKYDLCALTIKKYFEI